MKIFVTSFIIIAIGATDAFAQTGNFSILNVNGATSGSTILAAPSSGVQVMSLSNDDISGVNALKISELGLGRGLVFTSGRLDISVATQATNGFAGLTFRSDEANPFYFHSAANATVNINSTPADQGFFYSGIHFTVNRNPGFEIGYHNGQNNTGQRLNILSTDTQKGIHVGAEDTWVDRSASIISPGPTGQFGTSRHEILFQTGGTGTTAPVLNASIYHSVFPSFGSSMLHAVSSIGNDNDDNNDFGMHISTQAIYFGPTPQSISGTFEKYNFVGNVKAKKLLIGRFSEPSASVFPTDATYLLAVDGKVICSGAQVALKISWPDYVFDNDYQLMSLDKVDEYIKQHHHLPDVPDEIEVKENGIKTGEMHAALLKKVEELTLHVIAVNERIKNLEEENTEIERQLNRSK